MPKPVCVPCGRFFRPSKNGRTWTEMKPVVNGAPPGKEKPEQWAFYKAWLSDEWKCPGCGTLIIVGHAGEPFAQDYHPRAIEKARDAGADRIIINDC